MDRSEEDASAVSHAHGQPCEVFFCWNEWDVMYDSVKTKLPPWAVLKRFEPSSTLAQQVANADVLIPTTAAVGPDVIAAAAKLKLIAQPASGTDNIALEAAKARNIPVCTGKGLNAATVAEAALGMMLMLARRVPEQLDVFRRGGLGRPLGTQLAGKTLGIIGMGAIGNHLASAAKGLGMTVIGVASTSSRSDLEALLRGAHVISIHCPLNPVTHGLLGRAELAMTQPGVMIINYGRGHVIDKEALLEALESGHVGGAGLDVHWVEPADPTEPIYQHPRVIALPHTGTCTSDLVEMYAQMIADNVVALREGHPLVQRLL